MQSFQVSVPEFLKVVYIVGISIINHTQTQLICQFASHDTHFPKGIGIIFVAPPQTYIVISIFLKYVGMHCVMFSPRITPCEVHHTIFFFNLICQPSL